MDLNDVPVFVRVVETGSFTAAAAALRTQKSSVSRGVARLEAELGVQLIQRTTRHLALTDAGRAFFDRVRTAVAGVEEAADAARELGSEPRGVVRVTAPPDAHALGVPEAIARFVARHPAIRIEMTLTSRVVDLVGEGFDLAIRAGRLTDSTLVARKVGASELALLASPAYLRRRGRPRALADLADHDCVIFRGRGGQATWTLTGPQGDETVEVKGPLTVDEMAFVARAAIAGLGIALVPAALARDAIPRKELEVVLPEYRFTGGALHVVLPGAAFVPARVLLLRDFLLEELKQALAEAHAQCSKRGRRG